MTQENDQVLLPSSYVNKLFDTVKESSDHNTTAIKELTTAVNGLTLLLTAPPTHTEIHQKIKDHDTEIKLKDEKDCIESTKRFDSLEGKVDSIKHKLTMVLIVISVVFSLSMVAYLFVKNSIEYQIIDSVNKKTESIVAEGFKNRNPIMSDLDEKLNELSIKVDTLDKKHKVDK